MYKQLTTNKNTGICATQGGYDNHNLPGATNQSACNIIVT